MSDKKGWTSSTKFDHWDDVPDEYPGPPDQDLYKSRITVSVAAQTKKESIPCINLEFELLQPFGGGELGHVQRGIKFETLVVSAKAAVRLKRACLACGVKMPKDDSFESVEALAAELLGREPIIRVGHQAKKDDPSTVYARVADYLTPEKAKLAKISDAANKPATPAVARPPARSKVK